MAVVCTVWYNLVSSWSKLAPVLIWLYLGHSLGVAAVGTAAIDLYRHKSRSRKLAIFSLISNFLLLGAYWLLVFIRV